MSEGDSVAYRNVMHPEKRGGGLAGVVVSLIYSLTNSLTPPKESLFKQEDYFGAPGTRLCFEQVLQ